MSQVPQYFRSLISSHVNNVHIVCQSSEMVYVLNKFSNTGSNLLSALRLISVAFETRQEITWREDVFTEGTGNWYSFQVVCLNVEFASIWSLATNFATNFTLHWILDQHSVQQRIGKVKVFFLLLWNQQPVKCQLASVRAQPSWRTHIPH